MNAGMYVTVSLNSELPIFFREVEHLCLLILHILHTPFIGLACLKSIAPVKEWYGLGGVWLLLCCGWLFCEVFRESKVIKTEDCVHYNITSTYGYMRPEWSLLWQMSIYPCQDSWRSVVLTFHTSLNFSLLESLTVQQQISLIARFGGFGRLWCAGLVQVTRLQKILV